MMHYVMVRINESDIYAGDTRLKLEDMKQETETIEKLVNLFLKTNTMTIIWRYGDILLPSLVR